MFVRVTLYDPAAQAHQVELPAAEPIGRILPALIRRLRLPEMDGDQLLQYDLYRAGALEPLKPVGTLHMAGIVNGATLELRAALDPYARIKAEDLKARETNYRPAMASRSWRDYQAQLGLGLLALLALLLWGAYQNSRPITLPPPPTARPLIVTRVVAPTTQPVIIQHQNPIAIAGPVDGIEIAAVAALPDGLCFVLENGNLRGQLFCHHSDRNELAGLLSFSLEERPPELFAWAGELFLVQPHNAYYSEIWQSNGLAGGTGQLLSIPGLATTPPLRVGNSYLFGQPDAATGWQALHLYTAGSRTAERFANLFVAYDWHETALWHHGLLYFAGRTEDSGWELWRSDGTVAGTFMLGDINAGPLAAAPADLVAYGDRVLFVAESGGGRQIWQTDGTPAGTALFWSSGLYNDPRGLLVSGDSLFFRVTDGEQSRLLLQAQAGEIRQELPLGGRTAEMVAVEGAVYVADQAIAGVTTLWRLEVSTGRMSALGEWAGAGFRPVSLTRAGDHVYLILGDERALWQTTAAGDAVEPVPDAPAGLAALYAAGDTLYFTLTNSRGEQLGFLADGAARLFALD